MPFSARILGCGSSTGVPRIGPDGPDWGACDPEEPKNRRTRCSILVESDGVTILIDTSPDLREQMLAARCGKVDAVLYTHDHADQIHGIDDLRSIAYFARRRIPVYADAVTFRTLHARFGYCFVTPPGSGYPPILDGRTIAEPFEPFVIEGQGGARTTVIPFAQEHGRIRSIGFRIGQMAYSSDVSALDDEAFRALQGVEYWVVDALRDAPHPTHSHVAQSLDWIERVRPKLGVLTNMHLDLDYSTLSARLPPNVIAAYDGLVFGSAT